MRKSLQTDWCCTMEEMPKFQTTETLPVGNNGSEINGRREVKSDDFTDFAEARRRQSADSVYSVPGARETTKSCDASSRTRRVTTSVDTTKQLDKKQSDDLLTAARGAVKSLDSEKMSKTNSGESDSWQSDRKSRTQLAMHGHVNDDIVSDFVYGSSDEESEGGTSKVKSLHNGKTTDGAYFNNEEDEVELMKNTDGKRNDSKFKDGYTATRRSASESMSGTLSSFKPAAQLPFFKKGSSRGGYSTVSPLVDAHVPSRSESFAVTESPLYTHPQIQNKYPFLHSDRSFDTDAPRSESSDNRSRRQRVMDSIKRVVRKKVSKKKRRFQEGEFDLDLTYITPRVIAMGFPSQGAAATYRNPLHEVQRFFDTRHPQKYMIYNLCTEKSYPKAAFHNRVQRYPFNDHNAPPLQMMFQFCESISTWLRKDLENVAAVHCKAGKGRTGMMIAAYLLYSLECKTAKQALAYFGSYRTTNDSGVTIPSQKRYVYYFEQLLRAIRKNRPIQRGCLQLRRPTIRIKHIRIQTVPNIDTHGCIPIFDLYIDNEKVFEYKRALLALQNASEAGLPMGSYHSASANSNIAWKKKENPGNDSWECDHNSIADGSRLTFLYSQDLATPMWYNSTAASRGLSGLGISGLCGVTSSKSIRQYAQISKGYASSDHALGLSAEGLGGKPRRFLVHEPVMDIDCSSFDLRVAGNVKLSFKHDRLPAPTKLCHIWFHTEFVESPALVFTRQVIDKACKETRGVFSQQFSIELYLEKVDAPPLPPLKLNERNVYSSEHGTLAENHNRSSRQQTVVKHQETDVVAWGEVQDSVISGGKDDGDRP